MNTFALIVLSALCSLAYAGSYGVPSKSYGVSSLAVKNYNGGYNGGFDSDYNGGGVGSGYYNGKYVYTNGNRGYNGYNGNAYSIVRARPVYRKYSTGFVNNGYNGGRYYNGNRHYNGNRYNSYNGGRYYNGNSRYNSYNYRNNDW